MKIEKVNITKTMYDQCVDFAYASVDSSFKHWSKGRKVSNKDRIIEDIITGKIGECGAYLYLRSKGFAATKPDFNVYHGRQKSFDADIMVGNYDLHCKAQSEESRRKYGTSWILQYGGAGYGHTDKLFKRRSKHDYLIPMSVEGNEVSIYGFIPIDLLFEKEMIDLPKVKWLQNTKRAVYLDKIKTLSHYNRWGFIR